MKSEAYRWTHLSLLSSWDVKVFVLLLLLCELERKTMDISRRKLNNIVCVCVRVCEGGRKKMIWRIGRYSEKLRRLEEQIEID